MATSSKKDTNVVRIPSGVNMAHNPFTFGNTESYTTALTPSFLKYGGLLINGLAESYPDPMTGKILKRWIPRPILTMLRSTAPSGTSMNTGENIRGVIPSLLADEVFVLHTVSGGNDGVISVMAAETPELNGGSVTGLSSNAFLGGTELFDGTQEDFIVSVGLVRPYIYNGSFTQIADTDCPSGSGTSPHLAYMDGAIFIAKNYSIYNSEFAAPTSWPGYARHKEQYPDQIYALAKHKNSIVAFAENSIEFFFNAGYSGTSPLNRQESFASRIGYGIYPWFHKKNFVVSGEELYFIGKGGNSSLNRGFFVIDNFRISKISTSFIDTILDRAILVGPMSAFTYRGHNLISIVVRTVAVAQSNAIAQTSRMEFSLIYDINEKTWSIWTARGYSTQSTKAFNLGETSGANYCQAFPLEYIVTNRNFPSFGYHVDNRRVFHLQDPSIEYTGDGTAGTGGDIDTPVFSDYKTSLVAGTTVDFLIRYPTIDFGSMKEKYISRAYLVGLQNLDSGTPADISTFVFNSVYKESTGAYPTAIATKSYDDSMINNLSTGRKFIIEHQWTGNTLTGMDALELHVIEGEN